MQKTLKILGISYLVYLALSLLIITPALNFAPHWYLEDAYGRTLDTRWVLFNPFTLSLEVREAMVPEKDGTEFAGLDSLSVNLSLASLWQPGIVFDRLAVSGLFAHVVQLEEDRFNFDDFLGAEEPAPEEPAPDDGGLIALTVHDLHLNARELAYTDNARVIPATSRWLDMDIAVQDLSTVQAEGRPYTLDVHGPTGGKLSWRGTVSIPDSYSEGTLSLTELDLHTIWQVAEPWLEFEISEGKLTMEGRYAVNWGESLDYGIQEGNISLRNLDITPKASADLPDTGLRMAALDIQPVNLDGTKQDVAIGDIRVQGLALSGWMEEDRLSLQELFLGPVDPNEPAPAATQASAASRPVDPNEPTTDDAYADPNKPAASAMMAGTMAPKPTEEPGWSVSLGQFILSDGAITWRSGFTDPATLTVTPIEATIGPVNWPLAGETSMSLGLVANELATINLDGALALAEGAGTLNYSLQELPLNWFNPNLPPALKAKIIDGALGIEGAVGLSQFAPEQVDLSGAITNFKVQIETSDVPISGWETVRVEGVSVDMIEHTLLLEKLSINNYTGRLHIAEDGSVNTSNVWKEELGDQAEEIAEDLTADKPWTFQIPQISMTDSEVDFMDQSLPIPFRTVIGELNGEIVGLGGDKPARIDFEGSVDGYAPVKLNGSADPLTDPMFLDLDLSFDGVDMALLSPYSGTYAGYNIEQGLLTLDLGYSLENNHLQGANHIRMDQLKLGDKIESDKAIDAPLELALSIMTDASGVIDMEVPVSGDVDDPEFNIGGIVTKAFLNVITKAVTAPFTLLAGLVNSEDDLQRLTFDTGSAELEEANQAKLQQLADALNQRPKLKLSVTGRLKPGADRERMQKEMLKQQLVDDGLDPEQVASKGPDWDNAIAKRYRKLGAGSGQGETEPTSREKYLALAKTISISDEQLLQLAEQRATAVKTYLVRDLGLGSTRAVIEQPSLDEDENQFSGVVLNVK